MSFLEDIRKGAKLKKVPETEKNDRSTLAAANQPKPSTGPVDPIPPSGGPSESVPPPRAPGGMGIAAELGNLFAGGVPRLRSRTADSGAGQRAAPVPRAMPSRMVAPPPPPPPQAVKPPPPPPPPGPPPTNTQRAGFTSDGQGVPLERATHAAPKLIHINSPGGNGGIPPPPGMPGGKSHPPAPPPPVNLGPPASVVTSVDFCQRFDFLRDDQLPPPPAAYKGSRTYNTGGTNRNAPRYPAPVTTGGSLRY